MKTYVKPLAGIGICALSACGGASTGGSDGDIFEIAAGPSPPAYDVTTGVLSLDCLLYKSDAADD